MDAGAGAAAAPAKRQKREQRHRELLQRYDEFIDGARELYQVATHGAMKYRGLGAAKKRAEAVQALPGKIVELVRAACSLLGEISRQQLLHVLARCPAPLRESVAELKLAKLLAQQCV